MVDSGLAARGVTPRLTTAPATAAVTPSPRRTRAQKVSIAKQLQAILGPKVATARYFALLIISIEALIILFLSLTIVAKNNAIDRIKGSASFLSGGASSGYEIQSDGRYGLPPLRNDRIVQEAIDAANYDDTSPAITGISQPRKFAGFFGRFTGCKPLPCNIDHWAYIGEKCFYRDDHIKDRAGHNSSIWNYVDPYDWYYTVENDFACPVVVCRHQWREEMNLTEHIVLRVLQEHYQNDTPWNLENMYTGSKYMRVNHFWGLEYKLNGGFTLTRTDENGVETQENKTATITVRRGFTQKYCDVSVNTEVPPPEEPIYIVVPYTGRVEMLRLFYQNIGELLDEGVSLRVILATHGGPVHILGAAELLREMQLGFSEGELTDGHIVQVVEASGDRLGNFSRALALMDGARYVPAESLMFYCDVDMIIKKPFFDNCRYNAQRNYQVYYPIVYSLYPYGSKVSKEHGYWRSGAFGMVCGYKSDFERTTAWTNATRKLRGWGMEDVLLHRNFNNDWLTSVFHAVEPNLLHRWHPKYCEFNANVAACLGTVFQNMGSQMFLAALVSREGIDVRNVPYDPAPVTFRQYKNDSAGSKTQKMEFPAGESEPDDNKNQDFRSKYEDAIRSGKAGLLAIFAKEAQETMLHANLQQSEQARMSGGQVRVQHAQAEKQEMMSTAARKSQGSSNDVADAQVKPAAPLEPESPDSNHTTST